MLLTRCIAIETDALTLDSPLRAFASADHQLAVRTELEAESFPFPLRSDERALAECVRVRDGFCESRFRRIGPRRIKPRWQGRNRIGRGEGFGPPDRRRTPGLGAGREVCPLHRRWFRWTRHESPRRQRDRR